MEQVNAFTKTKKAAFTKNVSYAQIKALKINQKSQKVYKFW